MSSQQRLPVVLLAVVLCATAAAAADVSRDQAIEAMTRATRFFRGRSQPPVAICGSTVTTWVCVKGRRSPGRARSGSNHRARLLWA